MGPATKRRKLSPSENDHRDQSLTESHADGASDLSMNDAASGGMRDGEEEEEEEDTEEDMAAPASTKQKPGPETRMATKPSARRKSETQLRDGAYTAETFKSNVFKLQVDELLEQVKVKYGKKEVPVEDAMRTLKTLIEQLPSREPLLVAEAEKTLKSTGIAIPFPSPRPAKDAKYKFQYERPASINVTGSYPLKIATRTDQELAVDLVVTMPKTIFQDKDYLNYRYFYKRAYYLACLAAGIKKSKEHSFKLTFDCLHGNQLQPTIKVRPGGVGGEDSNPSATWCIQIHLALPNDTFPTSKLRPQANCIRPKHEDAETTKVALHPTPFYNSALQSDATVTSYLKLLHSTASSCDAFKDACVLGRVWLKQRGLASELRKGGFGNFEWATLMALLMQSNPGSGTTPLSTGYSSYQLFKATLQFISRHDLSAKPFPFQAHDEVFPKARQTPIFFDGPRGLNILFKMTTWSYAQLHREAKTTLDTLSDALFDQFDATFILRTDLHKYQYDATLRVPLVACGIDVNGEEYEQELRDSCHKIYTTLIRALTDRVTSISLSLPTHRPWPISASKARTNAHEHLLINFSVNPDNVHRTVDHGPAAENKQEAASFRKFWGEKSELRRFKDGSILESLVWSTKDTSRSVLEQIALYILGKHVHTRVRDEGSFSYDNMAHLIPAGHPRGQSGTAAFTPTMDAFAAFVKDVHELEDMPLQVRHIRAADAQLRYSSVDCSQTAPASVVVQFEASARWPDDLVAIQRTKIAFLSKLSELLSDQRGGYSTRVGLENPSQPSQNQAFLDVTTRSGLTFRLRIHHDREATLLDRQLKDKALDSQSRESAAVALALYNRDFVRVLSHTQVIQNLCTRYPALSPAIRLTKLWFASHLMSPHIAPELIELLVVRTFLQPHPWPVPSCATTAFLRTLFWISRWDWRHVPLIVDFSSTEANDPTDPHAPGSNRVSSDDLEKIQLRFEAWRRIDPAMNRVVLFAATSLDTDGDTWTARGRPEKAVAARMTALAKAATGAVRAQEDSIWASIEGKDTADLRFDPEVLFVPSTNDFDFVVHIATKYTKSGKKKKDDARFKNIEMQQSLGVRDAAAQLAQLFAEDLQKVYGETILWFYDPEKMNQIAGLWNPIVTAQRSFKVKAAWNSMPVKSKGEEKGADIVANKLATYNEMKRLGGDLITEIDVLR